jgi:hypothetical protein
LDVILSDADGWAYRTMMVARSPIADKGNDEIHDVNFGF